MMNKQLKRNINALDVQIGRLAEELEGMKENNRYEIKVRKIEDLTTLRNALKDGDTQVSKDVITEIDGQILELAKELVDIELDNAYLSKMNHLDDLTKIRNQLMENVGKNSIIPAVTQGVIGISALVIMLKYEEKDVITSKAVSMVMGMFRGK